MDVKEERAAARRLSAQAQQLRPRRRHRARGRHPAPPLRAPRGARGGGDAARKDRVFCSGANIYMLGSSTHAFKVNFCKYTNETRLALEDASQHSGLKSLAAVNGACAGGGYELALACDEILLVDDASLRGEPARGAAAGRAPGHGRPHPRGGQAQGAARPRRRLLEPRRRREGEARRAVAARGRDGAALEVPRARRRAGQGPGRSVAARRRGPACALAPARGQLLRGRRRAPLRHASQIDAGEPGGAAHRARAGRRTSRTAPAACASGASRPVGAARLPRAGRRAPRPALQPAGDRGGRAADRGDAARVLAVDAALEAEQGRLVRERGPPAHEARAEAAGPHRAHASWP